MRKRINNDFDALVEVLHEGVKIDLSLYEITSVRMVSNQAYKVTDYEVRNGSLFLHVTPLIVPKPGKYKIVVTYRMADPTLADGFWNFEFDKYIVTIVGSSEEEDAGEVVITADAVIGMRGKSAYQVWLDAGNTGTVEDFLADIKGDPFTYDDLTPEQIAELQQPATDAIASIQEVELAVETAEGLRVQAELKRQSDTATAISNAENATEDANDAAILANEKAGLANDAATLANEKAELANEKAGLAATATTQANAARDGANSAAQSATNLVNSYATDLAAKELKANKQNSLAPDGTGAKFPTVDAVNAGLVAKTAVKQTTGNSTTDVMSQNAVTDELKKINTVYPLSNAPLTIGSNGGFINATGNINLVAGWYNSGMIAILQGKLRYTALTRSNAYIAFYDLDKKFISSLPSSSSEINSTSILDFDIPANAGYINVSYISGCSLYYTQILSYPDTINIANNEIDKLKKASKDFQEINGFVYAETENPITTDVTNIDNWVLGEVQLRTGITTTYANGAHQKMNKSNLIKLNGGAVYSCKIPFVTLNTSCWLFNEDLSRINIYSVNSGNAINSSGYLIFDVDLSNMLGTYYLSLSSAYNSSTGVLDTNFTITNKYSYIKKTEDDSAVSTPFRSNNLRTQLSSFSKIGNVIGNYGTNDSVYEITDSWKRLSVKFKKAKCINSDVDKKAFVNTISENVIGEVGIQHALCSLEKVVKFPEQTASYNPSPITKSSYYSGVSNVGIEHFHAVGDKLFMIWLKGARQLTYPSQSYLENRSIYLQGIQDIYISINSDTLTIGRDGKDYNDASFNGGATSIIFTTSLKSGGVWKTIQGLYNELSNEASLSDFYFEFFNLSARTTCENIMQFGKLRLVGYYSQQILQGAGKSDPTYGMYYDSYPCYLFDKINRDVNYLDIILSGNGYETYINGSKIGNLNIGSSIQLISGEVIFEDLEIYYDDYGDAEIFNNILISERTPYIYGLMGHAFLDDYEDAETSALPITQSFTRLADICQLLKEKGYSVYSLADISDYYMGKKKLNKRSAFLLFDDAQIDSGYNNVRMRYAYEQFGFKINFAILMDFYSEDADAINSFISMRLNGHTLVSHSKHHDVPMSDKNSLILYCELEEMQKWCDRMHVNTSIFTYNWSGGWIPTMHMLNIKSYNIAVDSGNIYSNASTCRYRLGRINLSDSNTWSSIVSNCL